MFGLGDRFNYFKCVACRCLQIETPPSDWARYYPATYHSLIAEPVPQKGFRSLVAGWRDRACATGNGKWLNWLGQPKACLPHLLGLGRIPVRPDTRILDVGCGRGQLLGVLHRAGFRHLAGIDPFLASDLEVVPGLWVQRKSVAEVSGVFDLIMLHHVLEHIERQQEILIACRQRLAPDGRILVRIPTIDCEVWKRYRENSVQLDAPRHLVVHSYTSLNLLIQQVGLRLLERWCDSNEFQFWGSELYRRSLPLTNMEGRPTDPFSHFSQSQMKAFADEARRLNAAHQGDQLAAVLAHQD
jgi:SAM-dependent methyltransferase